MHWYALGRALAVPLALGLLAGCAEEIEVYKAPGAITAVFDPSATPPAVPSPTDLAKDQSTGLLKVPVADATTAQAQAYFDTFLNTLNGFPTSAVAEVKFDGELDETTLKDNLLVFDLTTDPAKPALVTDLVLELEPYDKADGSKASMIRVWNYAGWKRGTNYAFFVRGGANGVKGVGGKQVIRSTLFELAAADKPLCNWDKDKAWDASTKTCAAPAAGLPAAGCCTYSYSALIESSVKKAIREKLKDQPIEEQDKAIHHEVLGKATDFERIRRGYGLLLPIVEAAGWAKSDVVVLWNFTTVSMTEAVFDPSAVPPQLPTPTNLAKDPVTGLLNIPTAPTASEAEKAFNAYLSSLDGYPASTSAAALSFTGELESSSVSATTLKVFEAGATGVTAATDTSAVWDPTKKRVLVMRKGNFNKRGGTYVIAAVGGESGLKNKDGTLAKAPKRSALMHLVLSPYPLCSFDATTKKCTDVKVSSFVDDPVGKTGGRTGIEKATLFETMRQAFDPLLKAIEAGGTKRDEIVALWAFSIVGMSELIFDPTTSVIPFPNNLLLDPAGLVKNPPEYKVAIPASAGETPTEKALREGLNTLDGFTTQGTYFAPSSGPVDETSIKILESFLVLNLDKMAPVVDVKVTYDAKAGAIKVIPLKPLDEKTMYGIVLLSKLKAGDPKPDGTGLKDDKGRRVVPAPFMVLLRSKDPLVDAGGKSTVSTLDDATAKQAEAARVALKPFFDGLEANPLAPIKREHIVSAWTFRTQSITGTLTQLRALPWQAFGKAPPNGDGNQPKWQGQVIPSFAAATGWPASAPNGNLSAWVQGGFASVNLIDEQGTAAFHPDPTKAKLAPITLIMTLPKGTMPATGWPLVVFQHGINRSKVRIFEIADALGKAGYATLAFDIIYHGDRSWCLADAHCDGGTCDLTTGKCSTKLKDSDGDGTPDASGLRFLNPSNPFAVRDNMRQHVIDAASLLRSLKLPPATCNPAAPTADCLIAVGPTGLTGWGTNNIDRTKVHYAGQSLGAILGTLVMAVDPLPLRANLNVPGAPVVDIILSSPAFTTTKDGLLKALGITEGSIDYVQLQTTFNWILDPADPGNFAKYLQTVQLPDLVSSTPTVPVLVPKKQVMVQLAGNDQTIPTSLGAYLAAAIGFDTAKTVYANQGHELLLKPSPDANATLAAQAQMMTFFGTGTVCTPNLTSGTCN